MGGGFLTGAGRRAGGGADLEGDEGGGAQRLNKRRLT